jgi:hypothetical protein
MHARDEPRRLVRDQTRVTIRKPGRARVRAFTARSRPSGAAARFPRVAGDFADFESII